MKRFFLMLTMLLMFGAVNAQIGDVQQKGSHLYCYDGQREIGRIYLSSSDVFLGFSSAIVVIKKGNHICSCDAKGRELGRFYLSSTDQFRSVIGSNINIKKGRTIVTYDVNGREISRRNE